MRSKETLGGVGFFSRRWRSTVAILALTVAACTDGPTTPRAGPDPSGAAAAAVGAEVVTGVLTVHWGDPAGGLGAPRLQGTLRDAQGNVVQLRLDEATVAAAGGVRAVDGRVVEADGDRLLTAATGPAVMRVRSLRVRSGPGTAAATSALVGRKSYVTLLCKFADSPARQPRPRATYVSWMSSTYPGLDHYWRRMSYDQLNLSGSGVTRWYVLPRPRAAYFFADGSANLTMLADDCTGVADGDVDFRAFHGVNMQFNEPLDCCSWGGSYFLTRDGVNRPVAFTWMADWADLAVYAHETGHSLGLPHSSGPYGQTYDSQWDVMSNAYIYYDFTLGTYVPQGTIAYHRDLDGWVPAAEKFVMPNGATRTIDLDALGRVGPVAGYRMARVPLRSPGEFYTVEARDLRGYDAPLPNRAVLIHRVVPGRGSPAQVMDADGNGDPNDAGAMWIPGETFVDAANGVRVSVTQRTTFGVRVRISLQ